MTETVTVIKKDALIPIKVGAGFLQKLQQVLIYLADQRSKEEMQDLLKQLEDDSVQPGSWQDHYTTVITLIKSIEDSAISNKMVTEGTVSS